MININKENPVVKTAAAGVIGGAAGAAAGALKEAGMITYLKRSAGSASDYFVHSAKNSMRILDSKGMILDNAKKFGIIGAAVGLTAMVAKSLVNAKARAKVSDK